MMKNVYTYVYVYIYIHTHRSALEEMYNITKDWNLCNHPEPVTKPPWNAATVGTTSNLQNRNHPAPEAARKLYLGWDP